MAALDLYNSLVWRYDLGVSRDNILRIELRKNWGFKEGEQKACMLKKNVFMIGAGEEMQSD